MDACHTPVLIYSPVLYILYDSNIIFKFDRILGGTNQGSWFIHALCMELGKNGTLYDILCECV